MAEYIAGYQDIPGIATEVSADLSLDTGQTAAIAVVDGIVDAIKVKTDTIPALTSTGLYTAGIVDTIKSYTSLSEVTSSTVYSDVGGEQTIYEMTGTTRRIINGIWIDLVNITQNGTIKFYYKIDGTNYRLVNSYTFAVATDSDGVYIALNFGVTSSWKITYTEGSDESAARTILYSVIYEVRE